MATKKLLLALLLVGCAPVPEVLEPSRAGVEEGAAPVIGLTDTLYEQFRIIVRQFGGEPRELVGYEQLQRYFPGKSIVSETMTLGTHTLVLWKVAEHDDPAVLDAWIQQARDRGEDVTSAAFLAQLIDMNAVAEAVAQLDGLLVGGGQDVNPFLYAPANAGSETPHRTRDIVELAFISEALRQRKPILGVCRGSQILAVALGGQLIQDLPSWVPVLGKRHSMPDEVDRANGHDVGVVPGTALARVLHLDGAAPGPSGRVVVNVNSYHHQAVAGPFGAIEIGAWDQPTPEVSDDVVEGWVAVRDHFVVGTQWHPERPRTPDNETKAMFVDDPSALFPADRPYDHAVFESFFDCVTGQPACADYQPR